MSTASIELPPAPRLPSLGTQVAGSLPSAALALSSSPQPLSHNPYAMIEEKSRYTGAGSEEDPFIVSFAADDPDNPKSWRPLRK